jgi:hypothetical protein
MANEKITELDGGLEVWKLDCATIREQDINAQVMDKRKMKILTANVKNRGTLESLPYVYKNGDRFEVVSGHHRLRAAVAAGLPQIYALVETNSLTKSQIVSKQIAHNELTGQADNEILTQLVRQMEELDDIIASGLPQDYLNSINGESVTIDIPSLDFDWRIMQLTFLPKQMNEFETLAKAIDSKTSLIGIADREQYEKFCDAMIKYGRTKNIKSVGTTLSLLTEIALKEIEEESENNGETD